MGQHLIQEQDPIWKIITLQSSKTRQIGVTPIFSINDSMTNVMAIPPLSFSVLLAVSKKWFDSSSSFRLNPAMSSYCLGFVFLAYDTVNSCSNLFIDHRHIRVLSTCESLEKRDIMLPRSHQLATSIPFSLQVWPAWLFLSLLFRIL